MTKLKQYNPALRLIVSYADKDQNHLGTIYQATNWIYIGEVQKNGGTPKFKINGTVYHGRSVYSKWGKGAQQIGYLRQHIDPTAQLVYTNGKHKYIYPLDRAMARQIKALSKPYPKGKGIMRTAEGSG